jgi:DKNYY family
MRHFRRYFQLLWAAALLTACQQGYQYENNEWVWITYNEAAGRSATKIDSVDKATFRVLANEDYAVDKNSVFYQARKIAKADPLTFSPMGEPGYAKDGKRVFLDLSEVVMADPATFELLTFPYAKDGERIFCGTLPMNVPKKEVPDFKVSRGDDMRMTTALDVFIQLNPDFAWLDTLGITQVIVGEFATAETKTKKFQGFREVNQ